MALYTYQAKQYGEAKLQKGQIEATSVSDASSKLRAQNYLVLKIEVEGQKKWFSFSFKSVPLKEKLIFTRQLAVMIRSGLPIVKALEALERQTQNKYFQELITDLVKLLKGGQTLSKALAKYPKVFPEIYVAVVKAGEETGQLAEVLFTLADQQEKEADLISKIRGAMIYPGVILATMIGVGFLIVFFVLPSLESIFADSGQKLPILTRLLLGTSNFLQHYFLIVLVALVIIFFLLRRWFKTKVGQRIYDGLKIKVPIFGNLTRKLYMARFSRTMAMLVKASLPIIQSIKIVRKTISNVHYAEAFERIERAVESGHTLSGSIQKEALFPPMVGQLTSLGEETGNLENVLLEVATFYDKEVDNISKNLTTLLEPLMILLMGIGVGFIVAAVLGPIYGLVQTFN